MKAFFRLLLFILFLPGILTAQPSTQQKVALQFPGNPVSDVASFYEMLTGRRLIRDSNLAGPNITIVVKDLVDRDDAIALIESALLLNGYTLVPVDATTSKLLGTTKQPRSESLPLYATENDLPTTDQLVSFFMPFHYLPSEDASKIFTSYVTIRPNGAIVQVPNVNALIVTENAPLIRRLLDMKRMIDVPGARSVTEFFSLQRADAKKVAETLLEVFEKSETPTAAPAPADGNGSPSPAPMGKRVGVKAIADSRTNRVLVIASEQEMPYIRQLISSLDVGVAFEEPLERSLRFVSAGEVLPVLANLLTEGEAQTTSSPQSSTASSSAQMVPGGNSQNESLQSSNTGGTGSKPDRLRDPAQNTAPQSVIVGNARIIADRSSNKIIVIGPPESRSKAARVLDMLDQRPKQIYLATVIGQLTLGNGLEAGIKYPGSVTGKMFIGGGNGNGAVVTTSSTDTTNGVVTNGGVDVLPGTQELMNTAINLAAGSLSGLSIYGVIADSIDVTVSAMQSTNRFKVISRPVIYTANNKKAVISSGQQVPIPESSLTSSLAVGSQGTSIASNIEYKDVVLKLEVIPLINSRNEVTLTIAQQNDNVQETTQISDNQVPVIGTQELTTTVTVPNRHTIVLGGLITEEEREIKTGLPLLCDIPGLSYLFGSKSKEVIRRELIIMIQPFIIEDASQLQEANLIERANSGITGDFYDASLPVKRAELPPPAQTSQPSERTIPVWRDSFPTYSQP